jgi:hypothetical protein
MKFPLAVAALVLAVSCTHTAFAQDEMSMDELKAKNAKKLSKEELEQLMPGATVHRWTEAGVELYWNNAPDGKFRANERVTGTMGAGRRHTGGPGSWKISEDGRYCVDIDWDLHGNEKWCRDIYQVDSGYYMHKKGKSDTGGKAILLKIEK